MAKEITIAESFGLYFPVGDTVGAPGLVRGLRTAITYAGFAEAIASICPNAWVINYTNPMAICTRTLTRVSPNLKAFGCCHEVFATQRMLAGLVSRSLGLSSPPARAEIQTNVLGINHFTWIDRATWQGHDLLALLKEYLEEPGVMRKYTRQEVESWNDWFHSTDQVKFALFKHYGILAAAGDRHLVEFLPGFVNSPEILFRWGIIRTPISWRIERWWNAPKITQDLMTGRTPLELNATGEEGVAQIKALLGMGDLVTNINFKNLGQVSNLSAHVVVETNARFTRDAIHPLTAGALPAGLAPLITRHSTNQELIIEAALSKDKELAFQAVFSDPASHLAIDAAWDMYNQMLEASRSCLPGW
jgi:alpha-galactosidase/6-phospho-beta-glucosidase family protein